MCTERRSVRRTVLAYRRPPVLLCAAGLVANLLSGVAFASFLGITWQGDVYRFSEGTNAPSFLGASGFASVQGMAINATGAVYAVNHDSLFTIDPATGAGTLAAALDIPTNVSSPRGLAFSAGTLYAVGFRYNTIYGAGRLYTLDTSSGLLDEVNTNLVNGTGYSSLQSLEADDGALYAWSLGSDRLIRINATNGSGAIAFPGGPTAASPIQGLARHPDGRLFAARPVLYAINSGDGALTAANTNELGDMRGMAFSPEPHKSADLAVTQMVEPAVLDEPMLITCAIVVSNRGPYDTFAVTLGHVLSPGATIVQSIPPVTTRIGETNLYSLGTFNSGDAATVTISAFVDFETQGPITNGAGVVGFRPDPGPLNDITIAVTPLPDLDGDGRSDYADEDDDGDGMPDRWEQLHFGGRTNGSPVQSADADRATDLHEYIGGTDPTNDLSFLAIERVDVGDRARIHVMTSGDRYYSLYERGVLATGDWSAVDGLTERPGNGERMSFDGGATQPRRYYAVGASVAGPMRFVAVEHAGNVADSTGFGVVSNAFGIGRHEVTNERYAEFLNAAAAADTYELYNTQMGSNRRGGIRRTGSPGTYRYSTKPYMRDKPVNYVCFYDALRFANWMHNGSVTGAQNSATTEDGAYTFGGAETVGPRNPGATCWLPDEDEWYKAAYFDPDDPAADGGGTPDYWLYPSRTDAPPAAGAADFVGRMQAHTDAVANYNRAADWHMQDGNITSVGSGGTGSLSPCGATDMGGNLYEWTEGTQAGVSRVTRGGSWGVDEFFQRSTTRVSAPPGAENHVIGFRMAGVLRVP
jgi:formylglycine-generating enzyme